MVCVAWRGPSALDRYSFTAVGVLLEYLTDTPVAPLQRELVEVSWPLSLFLLFSPSPPFLSISFSPSLSPFPISFSLFLSFSPSLSLSPFLSISFSPSLSPFPISFSLFLSFSPSLSLSPFLSISFSLSHLLSLSISLCLFRLVIHFALRLTAVLWRTLRRALGLSSLECPWRRSTLAKKSESDQLVDPHSNLEKCKA